MRDTIGYGHAVRRIGGGFAELGVCAYNTIMENKVLSLLVISLVANCVLVVALAQERAQNDMNSAEIMELELINDSLGGSNTNISFRYN